MLASGLQVANAGKRCRITSGRKVNSWHFIQAREAGKDKLSLKANTILIFLTSGDGRFQLTRSNNDMEVLQKRTLMKKKKLL